MEVPVERVPPGSGVPLIGIDFFPGERLRIVLGSADGSTTTLGSIQAGPDGHFEAVVEVPAGIPAGPATVDAISTSGITVRATLTIDPGAPSSSYRAVFPTAADRADGAADIVPFVAAGLAVAALATLVLRTRRSSRAPDG